jgi:hypothetical protein
MKTPGRIVLSAGIALVLLTVATSVLFLAGRRSSPTVGQAVSRVQIEVPPPTQPADASPRPDATRPTPVGLTPLNTAAANALPTPTRERPIEEEFAEAGEDPGAVYYMSRVREAIRYGNRTFARQLFHQMKELHPDSPLLEESEALFNSRIQARRVR